MMDKISQALNAATGVNVPAIIDDQKNITEQSSKYKKLNENLEIDYDFARNNLRLLILHAMDIIPNAMALVKEAENARLFESTSSFIKTVAEINKDLLDITERNLKSDPSLNKKSDSTPSTITNNAIFVGTTDELFNNILNANKSVNDINKLI
jgi:hypothetical protein